jgi:hypothetical protein
MDKIHRFENESNTIYNFRKNFIINNINKLSDDYNTMVRYSKILANIKFKNCSYDITIYNKLKAYL